MSTRLALTGRGLRLTGLLQAAGARQPPEQFGVALLITENRERLVDELGNALAIRETAS